MRANISIMLFMANIIWVIWVSVISVAPKTREERFIHMMIVYCYLRCLKSGAIFVFKQQENWNCNPSIFGQFK